MMESISCVKLCFRISHQSKREVFGGLRSSHFVRDGLRSNAPSKLLGYPRLNDHLDREHHQWTHCDEQCMGNHYGYSLMRHMRELDPRRDVCRLRQEKWLILGGCWHMDQMLQDSGCHAVGMRSKLSNSVCWPHQDYVLRCCAGTSKS